MLTAAVFFVLLINDLQMKYWFFGIIACLVISCKHEQKKARFATDPFPAAQIFPVVSFINGQVHLVDSMKPPIVRFTTYDKKTDTASLTDNEFRTLADDFLHPDLSDPAFNGRYEESSFADQSIPAITLTYTALDDKLEIRRMDIIIQQDAMTNDKVQSIYLEKIINRASGSVSKKLFWKSNKYFQVTTNTIPAGGQAKLEQLKVVWDPTDSRD